MTAVALLAALVIVGLYLRGRRLGGKLRRARRRIDDLRDRLDRVDLRDAAIDALTARVAELSSRETSASIAAWQDETFGPATTTLDRATRSWSMMYEAFDSVRFRCDLSAQRPNLSRAIRAAEELAELIELLAADDNAAKAPEEVADIDIVLRGIDAAHGVERVDQVAAKMARNRARRWKVTGDGHGQHVDESTAESACADRNAFIDSELDPERDDAFRAHLGGCPSCRALLVGDVQLAARLSTLPSDGSQ